MTNKPEQIFSDLSAKVKGDIFTDIIYRAAYSTDASIYRIVPKCVVAPRVVYRQKRLLAQLQPNRMQFALALFSSLLLFPSVIAFLAVITRNLEAGTGFVKWLRSSEGLQCRLHQLAR